MEFSVILGAIMACGFLVPILHIALCIWAGSFNRDDLKILLTVGLPYTLIGCAGILHNMVTLGKIPMEHCPQAILISWVITICALVFRVIMRCRASEKAESDRAVQQRKTSLASLFGECEEAGVRSCKSEKDRQKISLIAKKYNISYTNLEALYKEAGQCYQEKKKADREREHQKELVELKKREQAQYDVLNEFSSYKGQEKKIAILTKEYNEVARSLQGTKDAISMTLAPPLEKEHDWAIMGGLANGLAGPGAGIATAVNAQIENAQIRARNSQLLHESADFRGQMLVAGAKRRDALQAKCSELDALINATKTKLIGKDSPEACLKALHFENTKIAVSKTGTCTVDTKVGLKRSEYYIFGDVKATIDGTIQGEIYDGNEKIGTANLVLPLDGVPDANMIAIKGICLFCGQPGKKYTVKFNADNLWAMEQ